jgi:hypothetical protein
MTLLDFFGHCWRPHLVLVVSPTTFVAASFYLQLSAFSPCENLSIEGSRAYMHGSKRAAPRGKRHTAGNTIHRPTIWPFFELFSEIARALPPNPQNDVFDRRFQCVLATPD